MTQAHLSANHRTALARAREFHRDRQEEQQVLSELNRRKAMKQRKTAQGDKVGKFPDTSGLLDAVEVLRDELTDLYDTAAAMQDRAARIERDGKPDPNRFSVLREG